jgi:Flp pilus assembly protein TadD
MPLTFENLWLGQTIDDVAGPNLAIWLIALAGLVVIWLKKEFRSSAVFVTGLLAFSFLAICPGLYFRPHYFVLMLPAVALLSGAAVGIAQKQWPRIFLLTYGVYAAALVFSVVQQREYLFRMSPTEITRAMYGESPFPEAIEIANYIRTHTGKDARIAVLGSEPEIPFYAQRRLVSGHIYMFGMVEDQPYALTMQKEFMHDVETSQPEYVVYVTFDSSWYRRSKSPADIFDWWNTYQQQHYAQLVGVANLISADDTEYRWGDFGTYQLQSDDAILIYKRTDPPDGLTAQLNHADALVAQGKLDKAAEEYRQASAVNPNSCVAHNKLSFVLDRQGLKQDALKELRISLAIQPEQTTAHTQMGRIFGEMHQYSEAVGEFTQVARLDPANAYARTDLAVALFQLGDRENAIEQFNVALQINPSDAVAKEDLAIAQAQLKEIAANNKRK